MVKKTPSFFAHLLTQPDYADALNQASTAQLHLCANTLNQFIAMGDFGISPLSKTEMNDACAIQNTLERVLEHFSDTKGEIETVCREGYGETPPNTALSVRHARLHLDDASQIPENWLGIEDTIRKMGLAYTAVTRAALTLAYLNMMEYHKEQEQYYNIDGAARPVSNFLRYGQKAGNSLHSYYLRPEVTEWLKKELHILPQIKNRENWMSAREAAFYIYGDYSSAHIEKARSAIKLQLATPDKIAPEMDLPHKEIFGHFAAPAGAKSSQVGDGEYYVSVGTINYLQKSMGIAEKRSTTQQQWPSLGTYILKNFGLSASKHDGYIQAAQALVEERLAEGSPVPLAGEMLPVAQVFGYYHGRKGYEGYFVNPALKLTPEEDNPLTREKIVARRLAMKKERGADLT